MSSRLVSYAKQDSNANLLLVAYDTLTVYTPAKMTAGLAAAKSSGYIFSQISKSIVDTPTWDDLQNVTDAINAQGGTTPAIGTLYRDFGSQLNFQIAGELALRFRLCQIVSNAAEFGNSGVFHWVPVFISSPGSFNQDLIGIVRTGSSVNAIRGSSLFRTAIIPPNGFSGWKYSPSSITNGLASVSGISYRNLGSSIDCNSIVDLNTLYRSVYEVDNQYTKLDISGEMFKDLGKTFDFTVKGQLAVRWQLVQNIQGATTEGCPSSGIDDYGNPIGVYYIVTYVADKTYYDEPVIVARTGSSIINTPETEYFLNATDVSGYFYCYDDLLSGIQNAAAANVKFTQTGSQIDTTSLSSMTTLYNTYIQPQNFEVFQNIPNFLFRDMKHTIDFTINGMLAIRLCRIQIMIGPTTEGVLSLFNEGDVFYTPIYVSDTAIFNDRVAIQRTG